MRVLFMGTGEIALPTLQALLASDHEVCGLVTQPDRPVGRHQKLHPPETKVLALEAGVPVLQPEKLRRPEDLAALRALAPELIVVMAYGQILPQALLDLPPVACLNLHASLLPRHRGASCLQAAIDAGDSESGVTIMHMAKGLDTGDMIAKQAVPLAPDETGGSLHDRLAALSPGLLLETLAPLEAGSAPREPQDASLATYAPKLQRADGELDWRQPASALERRIRAYHPWPGTFTWLSGERGKPRRLKLYPRAEVVVGEGTPGEILQTGPEGLVVACGKGALQLADLQLEGGKRLAAAEFLTGHRLAPGGRFFSLEQGGE